MAKPPTFLPTVKIPEWHKDHTTQTYSIDGKEWSVARLVELSKNLPIFDAPLNTLCLRYEYVCDMRDLTMHVKAVINADLKFPIILSEDGTILDGRHRVMKALLNGLSSVKAVRFDQNPEPCRCIAN